MFIGCDISGQLKKDKYYVLGTAWIPKKQLPKYEEAVCNFRLKNKLWGELKWTNVKKQKMQEYKNFLILSLSEFPINIKIILLDKKIVKIEHFNNSKGKMFSTFYYTLLTNHMRRILKTQSQISSFDILIDREDWIRQESLNLKYFLEKFLSIGGLKKSINHLSQCDSKICSMLQICDLITGAVSAVWNQNKFEIADYKQDIIKTIEDIIKHRLINFTMPTFKKFNLWLWRPPLTN